MSQDKLTRLLVACQRDNDASLSLEGWVGEERPRGRGLQGLCSRFPTPQRTPSTITYTDCVCRWVTFFLFMSHTVYIITVFLSMSSIYYKCMLALSRALESELSAAASSSWWFLLTCLCRLYLVVTDLLQNWHL